MRAKRPYHHANLKQNLLDAAVDLLAEAGLHGFTLREVARRAGVSHNAPYRHFRDKDDLVAAVAAEGFDRLTESMKEAMAEGSSAAERLRLAGRGYVEFAVGSPRHLVVMFETRSSLEQQAGEQQAGAQRAEYAVAGQRAFRVLLDAVSAVQAEGSLPKGDPHTFAVAAWAAVHGLAKLAVSGQLPFDAGQAIRFTNYLTLAMLHGMENLPHPSDEALTKPVPVR